MLLKLGYLLHQTKQVIFEKIQAVVQLFCDNTVYEASSDVLCADNDSSIVI